MAPQGARASTNTVRIRFIYIEETFQCLPEHMSILRPLTELWAHEHTEAIVRTMNIWTYWGHCHNYEHMSIQRLLTKYEHMSILRPLPELWEHEHTEAIARTMSTWAYWGHWQNYEHMSILRSLTELWAHENTEAIGRRMSTWACWVHWQN